MSDVPVIEPLGVYSVAAATKLLGLKANSLPRYMRRGQLRYSKRGGRVYVLGVWLLAFVEGGEVRRQRAALAAETVA